MQSTKVAHAPATEEVANRVWKLGGKILSANPQIKLPVHFQTIGDPKPEMFHIAQRDGSQAFITQGLVQQCKNDDQLAVLLCQELGEIASEQAAQVRSARVASMRPPMMTPPVGNDIGDASRTDLMIQGRYEKEQCASQPSLPPPMRQTSLRGAIYNLPASIPRSSMRRRPCCVPPDRITPGSSR